MHTRTLVSLIALALGSVTTQALAQETASPVAGASVTKGVELKGKAPVNAQVLDVRLPRPQEFTLSNGMRVVLLKDDKVPTFSLQWLFTGGGLADPQAQRGLAMVTADLLSEGTTKRSSRQIAEELARLGAGMGAGASPASGHTTVSLTGLSDNLAPTLALAAEVIREPSFPADELAKYKSLFEAQLQMERTDPEFLAREQFLGALYPGHPASLVVPDEQVMAQLTPKDLASYHAAYYRPDNALLVAHGALDAAQLRTQLETVFKGWARGKPQVKALPTPQPPEKSRVVLVERPGSVQTSLWLGSLGIERKHPDYFPMLVMNDILGGGPASRLFVNLREDKGYTYGVYSSFSGSSFPGVVVASTDVRNEVTEPALKELMNELNRIANEPVSERELEQTRRSINGKFALSLDAPRSLMNNLVTQQIYDLPADYWDTYPKQVAAVGASDVQRVARKYYDPKRLQIIAVGDGEIAKVLERYGTVEKKTPQ